MRFGIVTLTWCSSQNIVAARSPNPYSKTVKTLCAKYVMTMGAPWTHSTAKRITSTYSSHTRRPYNSPDWSTASKAYPAASSCETTGNTSNITYGKAISGAVPTIAEPQAEPTSKPSNDTCKTNDDPTKNQARFTTTLKGGALSRR